MAHARDYREDQSRKDWWDGKIWWLAGLTRNDLTLIALGFLLGFLYVKFPINLDAVFGLR